MKKNLFPAVLILFVLLLAVDNVRAQSSENVVTVDFAKPVRGVKSMSGFLHGIDANKPPDKLILPLQPRQWRVSDTDFEVYRRINKTGARVQLVLSDFWGYTGLSTDRPPPYRDFPKFEEFVRELARTYGSKNIIWDVWNEPEDGKLPYWKGTFKQFCETYRRAYQVLRKELGPNAIIGGPSFSRYDKSLLTQFLDYCKASGCEVNFLSWHELDELNITKISAHLDEARALFVNNPAYANLKIREIQINEIVGGQGQYSPGVILGYFYYLEQGNADGACKACWENSSGKSNCNDGALDGLIRQDTLLPTAAWWTYKIYADGVESRVASATTNPLVIALGSSGSSEKNRAQILIGYFKESVEVSAKTDVSVNLKNLKSLPFIASGRRVKVKVQKIRNTGEQAAKGLDFVSEKDFQLSSNLLNLTLNKVSVDEVYLLSVTNAEGAGGRAAELDYNHRRRRRETVIFSAIKSKTEFAGKFSDVQTIRQKTRKRFAML